jgi:hypothetical protein
MLLHSQAHRSSTDVEAWLLKKAPGVDAFLFFIVQCVMANPNGMVVSSEVS